MPLMQRIGSPYYLSRVSPKHDRLHGQIPAKFCLGSATIDRNTHLVNFQKICVNRLFPPHNHAENSNYSILGRTNTPKSGHIVHVFSIPLQQNRKWSASAQPLRGILGIAAQTWQTTSVMLSCYADCRDLAPTLAQLHCLTFSRRLFIQRTGSGVPVLARCVSGPSFERIVETAEP